MADARKRGIVTVRVVADRGDWVEVEVEGAHVFGGDEEAHQLRLTLPAKAVALDEAEPQDAAEPVEKAEPFSWFDRDYKDRIAVEREALKFVGIEQPDTIVQVALDLGLPRGGALLLRALIERCRAAASVNARSEAITGERRRILDGLTEGNEMVEPRVLRIVGSAGGWWFPS